MHYFVIIADDFTGANDTGVQLAKKGIPVDVLLDSSQIECNDNSLSIDTESRIIDGETAYKRVATAISQVMANGGCRFLYKKVDSTLRGNLKREIQAAIDVYQPDAVIFAPSYPAQGRTVYNGRLYVNDVPLLETEIVKDPRNPLLEDEIPKIMREIVNGTIFHISEKQLIDEKNIFLNSLAEIDVIADGLRVYTFDASTQNHLMRIVEIVGSIDKKFLWIGSAGLAEAILEVTQQKKYPTRTSDQKQRQQLDSALGIVGSVSSKTMEQLAYCKNHGVVVLTVPLKAIYEESTFLDSLEAKAVLQQAVEYLQMGQTVILTGNASRSEYESFIRYGQEKGISTDGLAEFAKQILSQMAKCVLEQQAVRGLFLTGGDTAIAVINQLGAKGSRIEREIVSGFVQSRLIGGLYDGLPIITKAGAFGADADIYTCLAAI